MHVFNKPRLATALPVIGALFLLPSCTEARTCPNPYLIGATLISVGITTALGFIAKDKNSKANAPVITEQEKLSILATAKRYSTGAIATGSFTALLALLTTAEWVKRYQRVNSDRPDPIQPVPNRPAGYGTKSPQSPGGSVPSVIAGNHMHSFFIPDLHNYKFAQLLESRKQNKAQGVAELETELKSYTPEQFKAHGALNNSLLHQAAEQEDTDLCQALVNIGASKSARNAMGKTPYELTKSPSLHQVLNY